MEAIREHSHTGPDCWAIALFLVIPLLAIPISMSHRIHVVFAYVLGTCVRATYNTCIIKEKICNI